MISNFEQVPNYPAWELEQAAAKLGLTPAEVEVLLDSELNLDHLIDYVAALTSNRMN
jgi:hypothetical protein